MKKVFLFNFNVGSAIEYVGDCIAEWIKECKDVDFCNHKIQNPEYMLFDNLLEFNPDIIILNEYYERTATATVFWKKVNPKTKIIFFPHVWQQICVSFNIKKEDTYHKERYLRELCKISNKIYALNYPPEGECQEISHKMVRSCHPMSPEIFDSFTPWIDRPKLFFYMGNILPHKLSKEFIEKIQKTDIVIDCYGKREDIVFPKGKIDPNNYKDYYNLFDNCKNLIYHGVIPQDDVPKKLNEYKFFVMPHDGAEPFNCVLLQSMLCGTIPLVVNDKYTKNFDHTWLHWAEGLYFHNNTVDDFIENLIKIKNASDISNASEDSERIYQETRKRFDYYGFKKDFQTYLNTC